MLSCSGGGEPPPEETGIVTDSVGDTGTRTDTDTRTDTGTWIDTSPPTDTGGCGDGDDLSILLDDIPAICSFDDLGGQTCGADPTTQGIATYIYLADAGGWWSKPTFSDPLVSLDAAGRFVVDITTGGIDQQATEICAYLWPWKNAPPEAQAAAELPDELSTALASTCVQREATSRLLDFAGRSWVVKDACGSAVGPGPCVFLGDEDKIWVDESGHLHLTAGAGSNGQPYCTEIYLPDALGYGE
jgi:hypothetical protein